LRRRNAPDVVKVARWLRLIILLVLGLPIAIMMLGSSPNLDPERDGFLLLVALHLCALAVFLWLFLVAYSACSIALSCDGVSQIKIGHRGNIVRRYFASWSDICQISVRGLTVQLYSIDGVRFELNTSLFGSLQNVILIIEPWLPHGLRAQLKSLSKARPDQ
jgi:hypothetical protein